jgi:hypothetical protein
MDTTRIIFLVVLTLGVLVTACRGGDARDTSGEAGLRRVMQRLTRAIDERDSGTFVATRRRLEPDPTAVKRVLRDGVPAETVARIVDEGRESLEILGVDFTDDIEIHHEVVRSIAAQDTPESGHFSGAQVAAARELLRPDVTLYNVRLKMKRGQDKSLRSVVWDGERWRVLGNLSAD